MNNPLPPAVRPDFEPATLIKVSLTAHPSALADTIASVIREYKVAHVQAIGFAAVSHASSAIAIADGYLGADDIIISWRPRLVTLVIDGEERTAIQFVVKSQSQ